MMTKSKSNAGQKSKARPVGRPRKIDSPERFDELVDIYILSCQDEEKPRPITITGLVLALGFCSKDTLYEYEKFPEFTDSVKRARLLVEQEYENRLLTASSSAGPIFALKNFGWADKHPTELDRLHAEKLKRDLQIDEEEVQPATVNVGVKDARTR